MRRSLDRARFAGIPLVIKMTLMAGSYLSHAREGIIGSAVARAAVYVAIAGQAWFRRIGRDTVGPVVADLALLAVDAGRVFLRGICEQSLSPRTMPRNIILGARTLNRSPRVA